MRQKLIDTPTKDQVKRRHFPTTGSPLTTNPTKVPIHWRHCQVTLTGNATQWLCARDQLGSHVLLVLVQPNWKCVQFIQDEQVHEGKSGISRERGDNKLSKIKHRQISRSVNSL